MLRCALVIPFLLTFAVPALAQQPNPREKKVRDDKTKVEADGYWIYNDLAAAFAEAKKTGKPIFVCLRCIPCVECVKLDDDLVNTDPVLRPLLDQFVRVRVVSTNNLDLSLFQYDYDQSFACFMLNADGTIYGRFGTRSHRTEWIGDVSLPGLAKALEGTLALHQDFAKNKPSLAGKRGPTPEFPTPEKFPTLSGKYSSSLNYAGNVVQSCIHCHQIGDAQKAFYRAKKGPMPEKLLFPYPHPKTLGLILDPKQAATVLSVEPGSLAAKAGFATGDVIKELNGQPILSIADVQWVLHNTKEQERQWVEVSYERKGERKQLTWQLPDGWKQQDDISWRSSTWGLRRMATGGLILEVIEGERPAGVPKEGMALRVKGVGQYGPHAAAKNAGFLKDDVIIAFDGRTDLIRETDVLIHGLTNRKPGDSVKVTVVRGGKTREMKLPMQE